MRRERFAGKRYVRHAQMESGAAVNKVGGKRRDGCSVSRLCNFPRSPSSGCLRHAYVQCMRVVGPVQKISLCMNGSIPKIILNAPDVISGMLIVGRKQDCSISSHFVPSRLKE